MTTREEREAALLAQLKADLDAIIAELEDQGVSLDRGAATMALRAEFVIEFLCGKVGNPDRNRFEIRFAKHMIQWVKDQREEVLAYRDTVMSQVRGEALQQMLAGGVGVSVPGVEEKGVAASGLIIAGEKGA
jgi:hypothetical protein